MQDYEKLGAFYLGREHDLDAGKTLPHDILYDAKDLTTHGVCVGMTGSGKTGLCLGLIEEAAIDGIPVLAIDPKGDLGNLMLTFPGLKPESFQPWVDPDEAMRKGQTPEAFAKSTAAMWKKGLAEWDQDGKRIQRLKDAADVAIYTPGSTAGLPLTVLRSFNAPPEEIREDSEAMAERTQAAVSGLLALLGINADPLRSQEHILISNILTHYWREGQDVSLTDLIRAIQIPPFNRIGVFDLDAFYPEKDRMDLAMQLNGVLASPGFSTWLEGDALDIGKLMYTESGKPRICILSIAHLSESERMFFVTILLNEVLAWVRTQPGTSSLRALLYMDEIFGYFPPSANPPSKKPMLTLLKQARAYGLGVLLATQNPVDLDYKGLSNTGTWFIGRLQTERDKLRVLDGLEGASSDSGTEFNRSKMEKILSNLGGRVFLMHNVHEDSPVIFHTRWAMSYLRGPLTRNQIKALMAPIKALKKSKAPTAESVAKTKALEKKKKTEKPALPKGVDEFFLAAKTPVADGARIVYRPRIAAVSKLHYVSAKAKTDTWQNLNLVTLLPDRNPTVKWNEADPMENFETESYGLDGAEYAPLPSDAANSRAFKSWEKELKSHLYQERWMKLFYSSDLKLSSKPNVTEGEFRGQLAHAAREARDLKTEKMRKKYATKLASCTERIRKAEQKIEVQEAQYKQKKMSTFVNIGTTVLGALFGRKSSAFSKAATTARSASTAAKERGDISRAVEDRETQIAKLAELEAMLQLEIEKIEDALNPEALLLDTIEVRPRKTDITVFKFGLLWTPWSVAEDGIAEPLF